MKIIQIWLNQSWAVWGIMLDGKFGIEIRLGRIVIRLFGLDRLR